MKTNPLSHRQFRLALLTWTIAWPVISGLMLLLQLFIQDWPLLLRTFVLSGLMVMLLTLWIMPRVTRIFAGWLAAPSPERSPAAVNIKTDRVVVR